MIPQLRSLRKKDTTSTCMCICMCKCIYSLCAVVIRVQICRKNCLLDSSCLVFPSLRMYQSLILMTCTHISHELNILFKLDTNFWTIYVKMYFDIVDSCEKYFVARKHGKEN